MVDKKFVANEAKEPRGWQLLSKNLVSMIKENQFIFLFPLVPSDQKSYEKYTEVMYKIFEGSFIQYESNYKSEPIQYWITEINANEIENRELYPIDIEFCVKDMNGGENSIISERTLFLSTAMAMEGIDKNYTKAENFYNAIKVLTELEEASLNTEEV
jgi:hypothetical protein